MRSSTVCLLLALIAAPALADEAHEKPQSPARAKFGDGEKMFRDVKAMLLKDYVDEVSEEELYRGAVAGMLAAAGHRKWDALIAPDEYTDMHSNLGGQMIGIGVELDATSDHEVVTVLGTFPGSPAEKADLRAGDRLLRVNEMPVKKGNAMDAIRMIRGKQGTKVRLTLLREDQVLQKTLVRAPISVSAVSSVMLPDGNAVVWIRQFGDKTPALLREQLQTMLAKKPHGLVIDLRGNQGGLLEKMVECVGLVLPRGATIAVEQLRGKREEPLKSSLEPLVRGLPLAVLINGETASGAELFAAALRDNLGARVVGTRTTGKWNVQRVTEIGNGYAVKYTIGLFKTPKGVAPDGKGLDPDVPVEGDMLAVARAQRLADATQRLAADAQLRAAVALIK
jgi:carboxyl-terminal processing protease